MRTPDGPKWTAQGNSALGHIFTPDGPKWTAQSGGGGRGENEGITLQTALNGRPGA